MRCSFFILLLFFFLKISAQQNRRCKTLDNLTRPVCLDSLTILPSSFSFSEKVEFTFDQNTRELTIHSKIKGSSLQVCYNVLPILITKQFSLHQSSDSSIKKNNKSSTNNNIDKTRGSNLKSTGIINRGVNSGNNQDISVDSYMDFRLKGNLTDDVEIEARLFDRNIPYQPEGNTHHIKNFDRVFVKVQSNTTETILGDITFKSGDEHFMKYNKSVMGAEFNYHDSTNLFAVGAGMNKGKFSIDFIQGEEGNYGPYSIQGPETDRFIIIISGTERVYLDDVLLKRGSENDYIIDYDLAEITFLPSVIISDYSRIRVEFEYRNLGMIRSVKKMDFGRKRENFSWRISYLGEKDQLTGMVENTPEDIWTEMQSGAHTVNQSTHTPVDFQYGKVSYIISDTIIVNGNAHSIYEYSTDQNRQHYDVSFSYKGENTGDYIRQYNESGQIYYLWVAPENGQPQGTYSPWITWQSPVKREYYTGKMMVKINSLDKLEWELTMSSVDKNILSDVESDISRGFGSKISFQSGKRRLSQGSSYFWSYGAGFEYHSSQLELMNPVFSPGFNRKWGQNNLIFTNGVADRMGSLNFSLMKGQSNAIAYKVDIREKGNLINGGSHSFNIVKEFGNWRIRGNYEDTRNSNRNFYSIWSNKNISMEYDLKKITGGVKVISDKNAIWNDESKTRLISTNQNFDAIEWFLRSSGDSSVQWKFDYQIRNNFLPENNELILADKSSSLRLMSTVNRKKLRVNTTLQYRLLNTMGMQSSNLMGKLMLRKTFLNDLLIVDQKFSTVNGWEPRRDFIYVEVPVGQGFYTWIDENNDGVQQIAEFYEAIYPDEKKYVRLFVPGTSRIPVYNNSYSTNFDWRFPLKWSEKSLPLRIMSGISGRFFYSTMGKVDAGNNMSTLDFISPNLSDTMIISGKQFLRSSILYRNPLLGWSLGLNFMRQQNKNRINDGSEFRVKNQGLIFLILPVYEQYELELNLENGSKSSLSGISSYRNFAYTESSAGISLKMTGASLRQKLTYSYRSKLTQPGDLQMNTQLGDLEYHFGYSLKNNFTIGGNCIWSQIRAPVIENKVLAYEIMNGGEPGSNFRWQFNLRKEIFSEVDGVVFYYGRKIPGGKVIHQASVQLSARF